MNGMRAKSAAMTIQTPLTVVLPYRKFEVLTSLHLTRTYGQLTALKAPYGGCKVAVREIATFLMEKESRCCRRVYPFCSESSRSGTRNRTPSSKAAAVAASQAGMASTSDAPADKAKATASKAKAPASKAKALAWKAQARFWKGER